MAFSLRLSPALDARARARAEDLGLSMNALVSVAVDLYLRVGDQAERNAVEPVKPAAPQPPSPPSKAEKAAFQAEVGLLDGKYTMAQVEETTRRQRLRLPQSKLDREILKWVAKGGLDRAERDFR